MVEPLKLMLDSTAAQGRKTHPLSDILDRLTGTVERVGTLVQIVSSSYDRGDFCQGLTLVYYLKVFYQNVISTVML